MKANPRLSGGRRVPGGLTFGSKGPSNRKQMTIWSPADAMNIPPQVLGDSELTKLTRAGYLAKLVEAGKVEGCDMILHYRRFSPAVCAIDDHEKNVGGL